MAHSYPVRVIHHLPRAAVRVLSALCILIVAVIIASFFVDGPLRRSIERGMNQRLRGYAVTIDRAHFSIFGPSVTLGRMIVRQTEPDTARKPEPHTVALIQRLRASLQWRALLTGHLVSDFTLDTP